MSPDPEPISPELTRFAATGLGVGTADLLAAWVQKWVGQTVEAKWLKIIAGYLIYNYGEKSPIAGAYLPDFGAGVVLSGISDLVVEWIVPKLPHPQYMQTGTSPTQAEVEAIQRLSSNAGAQLGTSPLGSG